MGKLIDADELKSVIHLTDEHSAEGKILLRSIYNAIDDQPEAVVRCKDCIHRPTGDAYNHDLEFPNSDYKCPCRCEDNWYSWMPGDNWYCANGERRTDE